MGCGKSKHAVITETTIVKSKKSDDGKETRTTKTVTEKGDSISVQEVETTSSFVEDTKKETTTTKVDPVGAANAGASVAPTLSDGEVVKQDEKVAPTDHNGEPVKAVKEDEEVKGSNPTTTTDTSDVVPTSNEGVTEVVKDDEKKGSATTDEKEAKTENVGPTLTENVMEATLVVKNDKKFKEPKDEMAYETPMKTTDDLSNTEFTTPKVQEKKDVAIAKESTKVETKKEEDVKVTGADIAKAATSATTEPKKVPTIDEANVAETKGKET